VTEGSPVDELRLQPGEDVVLSLRRSAWPIAVRTVLTLGLYRIWWRAGVVTVTNQRIHMKQGVLNKAESSLPMRFVQDASMRRSWLGVGSVEVSTAGGGPGDAELGPFAPAEARRLKDTILAQAQQQWGTAER
jgi:membrane protein YdbS with pleckstrin-like domain